MELFLNEAARPMEEECFPGGQSLQRADFVGDVVCLIKVGKGLRFGGATQYK